MSIADFQNSLIKYKKYLAVFVACCLLLCSVYIETSKSYTAEIFIKYLGQNAESGATETGSKLNPYEIADALVVKKALQSIGQSDAGYSAIRKSITITPIVSTAEQAKYASYLDNFSDYSNTENDKKQPVCFSVRFVTNRSEVFARRFLNALVESYRAFYAEKYAYSNDIAWISGDAVMQFDYYETAYLLETKLKNNIEYLQSVAANDTDYRSAENGYSLLDLAAEYQNLLNHRLADVSENILTGGISRTGTELKLALQNKADNAGLESARNAEKATTERTMMATYSEKNKDYMWDTAYTYGNEDGEQVWPGVERDREYDANHSVYDQLVFNYVDFGAKAADLLIDQSIYLSNMACFPDVGAENPEIEAELKAICEEYNRISRLTEQTIADYNDYTASRYVARISGIATGDTANEVMYYASTLVLSLGLGIIVLVFLELKRKRII